MYQFFVVLVVLVALTLLFAPGERASAIRQRIWGFFVGVRVCPVCNRIQVDEFGPWEHPVFRKGKGTKVVDACPHHERSGDPGDCRWCHILRVESLA